MTARHVKVGEYTEEQLRVQRAGEALHRDGASPAGALELLAAIVEDRTWERVTDKAGGSFKGRFREFVNDRTAGLGYDPDQLPKVLALQHPHESVPDVAYRMATMREEVVTLLLTEISRAAPHGGDRRSEEFQDVGHNLNTLRSRRRSVTGLVPLVSGCCASAPHARAPARAVPLFPLAGPVTGWDICDRSCPIL